MNPASPLYPSMKKKTKNEENKVLYQNVFFKKLKGLITSQKKRD
jgi:hypothetical protein